MREQIANKAIEILRATNDGDDLTSKELALLELAVNQRLNPLGLTIFEKLHTEKCGRMQ
jgi:hypothetical protein